MSLSPGKSSVSCLAAVMLMAAVGCGQPRIGGTQAPDEVINELRDENQALKDEVAKLQRNIELRLAEIDTLNQEKQSAGQLPGTTAVRMETLVLDRLTGLVDNDGDGVMDVVRAYVQPRDGQDRFLPVSAVATMQLVVLEPGSEPVVLAEGSWDAKAWNDAYRSGFTGSHYTLELPLNEKAKAAAGELTLLVTVTDGSSGVRKAVQKALGQSR